MNWKIFGALGDGGSRSPHSRSRSQHSRNRNRCPTQLESPGGWKWKELGQSVRKREKGIRILAPIIGVRRKMNEEAEKDITTQNKAVLVGFSSTYVFDVLQIEGADLPEPREISGDVARTTALIAFIEPQGIGLVFFERIAERNRVQMRPSSFRGVRSGYVEMSLECAVLLVRLMLKKSRSGLEG